MIWVLSIIFVLGGVILKIVGKNEPGFTVDDLSLTVGVCAFLIGLLWLPVRRHEEMEAQLKPRMDLKCGAIVEGSRPIGGPFVYSVQHPNGHINQIQEFAQWLRLVVLCENLGPLKNARVQLTKIQRVGLKEAIWSGESEDLTFVPGDRLNATREEIPDGGRAVVDVFAITQFGRIFIGTQSRIWRYAAHQPEVMFNQRTEYILTIIASADATKSKHCHLRFTWTGNQLNSALDTIYVGDVPKEYIM